MLNKIFIPFIIASALILCSCDKNDKDCLSPNKRGDAVKYDDCTLRSHNTPSPKKEW
ncbi:Uncharacterised protein [Kluyvera cryocrescens]|nr:Uncharacterised protein [Kluyvera cryocrescens]